MIPALAFGHYRARQHCPIQRPTPPSSPGARVGSRRTQRLTSLKKKEPGKDPLRVRAEQAAPQARHSQAAVEERLDGGSQQGPEGRAEHRLQVRESQPAIQISKKKAKKLRKTNIKLLRQCKFNSIQDAVTASHNNDRVEIMPGLYTEPKSRAQPTNDPACAQYKITNDRGQAAPSPTATSGTARMTRT